MAWIDETKTSFRVRFHLPDGKVGSESGFKTRRAAERRRFELDQLAPHELPGADTPGPVPQPAPTASDDKHSTPPEQAPESSSPAHRRRRTVGNLPTGAIFAPFERPYDRQAAANAKIAKFAGPPTLYEYVQVWAVFQKIRANTALKYDSLLRCHILPRLGHLGLDEIDFLAVDQFYAYLADALAPESARNAASLLSTILRRAAAQQLIGANPCEAAALPIDLEPREAKTIATAVQMMHIAERLRPAESLMVLLAAYTGLRWGEIAGLTWDRVRLDHKTPTVTIPWADGALHETGGKLWLEAPKSLAAVRTVSFPRALIAPLASARTRAPSLEHLVFQAPQGGPLRRSNFVNRRFAPAVAGNPRDPDLDHRTPIAPGMTFHSLRHMQESWMIADGLDPWIRNYRMGHKTSSDLAAGGFFTSSSEISEVSARYSHMLEEMHEHVADLMQSRLLAAQQQYQAQCAERARRRRHELIA